MATSILLLLRVTDLTAQTASPAEQPALSEVVVTAQHREQNLQDVGIAITVLSGDDLRNRGLSASTEIADLTPGVHMSGSLAGQSQQFSIRSVTQNDFNDSIEAPIAVYIDDAYIPNQQGQTMSLFDISRVEVLKGPQGTLFGRNATGGLVQFVVNRPTRDFEGYGNVSYGRFGTATAEGAVSGPLSDTVAARLSFFYDHLDNFWQNEYPAGAAAGLPLSFGPPLSRCCSDEGGHETYAGRLQIEAKPNDQLDIRLVGSGAKRTLSTAPYTSVATTPVVDAQGRVINSIRTAPDDTRTIIGPDGGNYFNPALFPLQGAQTGIGFGPAPGLRFPGNTWFGYKPLDPRSLRLSVAYAQPDANTDSAYSGTLHVDYDLGAMKLASISNYLKFEKMYLMDAAGTPQNLNQYGTKSEGWSFSQELRLSGEREHLHWQGGVYFLHINTHGYDGLLGSTGSLFAGVFGASATGIDPIANRTLQTNSTSVFGQVEYEFVPKWTVIVGARGINEQQDYKLAYYGYVNVNDYKVDTGAVLSPLPYDPFTDSRTQHLWAGKFQLEYRPVDGLLVFLGINRGVKAGSYNAKTFDGSPPIDPAQVSYQPEVLVSVEGGAKWIDAAHRYSVGASVYHYNYDNYQAFQFTNNSGIVQNVKDRTTGFELEGTAKLFAGLEATGGYAYSDANIPNYQIAPGVFKDVRPTFASKQQANLALTYNVPARVAGGQLALTADVAYSSSFYDNLRNFASEELSGRTLTNAAIGWNSGRPGLRVGAYIKNIADKRYPIVGFDSSPNCGCSIEAYGMPRTYGVTVGGSF
ncbi:MAG TPA: TonB-dependent receptor [Steroidobacteraceae bacterium]|nr:TonB-dependent receptor [Steroidobacteraceae bacterium]